MKSKRAAALMPGLSGLFVAAFFLFAALWVNGDFPVTTAVGIAVALGAGTYLAVSKSARRKKL